MKIKNAIVEYVSSDEYVAQPQEISLSTVAAIAAQNLDGPIVEIGAGCGKTTAQLLIVAKQYDRMVYVIDPYSGDMPPGYGGPNTPYTKENLMDNVEEVNGQDHFTLIEQSSQDMDPNIIWNLGPLCFAFVDGLQDRASVINDLRLVSKCSVIAVDDYKRHTEISQVAIAVEQFIRTNSVHYDLFVDGHTERSRAYLFRVNK